MVKWEFYKLLIVSLARWNYFMVLKKSETKDQLNNWSCFKKQYKFLLLFFCVSHSIPNVYS